jgi:hypothetical protein
MTLRVTCACRLTLPPDPAGRLPKNFINWLFKKKRVPAHPCIVDV